MKKKKKLEIELKELMIKDLKLTIKRRRVLLMLDRISLWEQTRLKKELDDIESKMKKSKDKQMVS